MTTKTAVVLFNLGGPDSLDDVQPFLFNLFNDPAIIHLPGPLRWLVAVLASRRRAPVARKIYQQMGGRSPILEFTQKQKKALEHTLGEAHAFKIFIAMRYSQPFIQQVVKEVATYAPDQIFLLPLYPQFSTTTTGSSFSAWKKAAADAGLNCPQGAVCCYPVQGNFVRAHAQSLGQMLTAKVGPDGGDTSNTEVLFSAHGLPKRVIDAGDPYAWQVQQTAIAVIEHLKKETPDWQGVNWRVCYQSRVGPLEWIGPHTEEIIIKAAKNGKRIVVVPIAFVSEHSETLVELDVEYRTLAEENGAAGYYRVPALGAHQVFIDGLEEMVRSAIEQDNFVGPELASPCSAAGGRSCPGGHTRCPVVSA